MKPKMIFLAGIFVLCSCKHQNTQMDSCADIFTNEIGILIDEENPNEDIDFIENFDLFYAKFERDSIFQISRIVFPLKGFCSNFVDEYNEMKHQDTVTDFYIINNEDFYLKKESWKYIPPIDPPLRIWLL